MSPSISLAITNVDVGYWNLTLQWLNGSSFIRRYQCLAFTVRKAVCRCYNKSISTWVSLPHRNFDIIQAIRKNKKWLLSQSRLKLRYSCNSSSENNLHCMWVCTVCGCMRCTESFNPIWHATYCDSGYPRLQLWFGEWKDNYFTFHLKFIIQGRERETGKWQVIAFQSQHQSSSNIREQVGRCEE